MSTELPFLALSVGNTTTHIASIKGDALSDVTSTPSTDLTQIIERAIEAWNAIGDTEAQIIIASSNDSLASDLSKALADQTSSKIWTIGTDLPVAIGQHLDPETITGIDRLLNAAAAWDEYKQACVIVDAGTCVTVDFVDGEGTFHGGAIAPGAAMQLSSMHDGTNALPEISFEKPLEEAFGKNTAQAMLQGVYHGIKGMVRQLTEQYASRYGAYPMVIATGGDAPLLFEHDEFIEHIEPNLLFKGIAVSVKHALALDENE